MPKHLVPVQSYANEGAAPAPNTLPAGWLLVIDGKLNKVNDAQDGFDVVGGAGGIALLGHPAQDWSYHSNQYESLYSTRNFEYRYDPGDGAGYLDDFEEIQFDPDNIRFDFPQFGGQTAGFPHLPERCKITLRWWNPVEGTFNLQYLGETGNFQITVTLNGGTPETPFTNSPDATYTLPNIPVGFTTIEIVVENTSGGITGSQLKLKPYMTPTVTPDAGDLFFDELSNTVLEYRNGEYTAINSQPLLGASHPTPSSLLNAGRIVVGQGFTGNAASRSVGVLGTIGANGSAYGSGVAIGWGTYAVPFPGVVGYQYSGFAIGAGSRAWTAGLAIGDTVTAGPLATAIQGSAADECVALGYGASAKPRDPGSPASPVTYTAVGSGNGYGTHFYYHRGVDTNGFPTTNWVFGDTEALSGDNVDVVWPTSGWPAGTTDVEIRRENSMTESTFLRGTVASGGLTDDFTTNDRIRNDSYDDFAFNDWYGWDRERRSIAIGLYTTAGHLNSVVIDNDQSTTEYNGQFLLGNDGNIVSTKGGRTRRVETVTTTATLDTSGFSDVVIADSAGGAFTVTLGEVTFPGREVTIKKKAGTNNVTIATPGAETIDGNATHVLSAAYDKVTLLSDGSNWFIV